MEIFGKLDDLFKKTGKLENYVAKIVKPGI
jgi:hypothetical protein